MITVTSPNQLLSTSPGNSLRSQQSQSDLDSVSGPIENEANRFANADSGAFLAFPSNEASGC